MAFGVPITVLLGSRSYEVRWTKRAEARNASLPRPVSFGDIGKRKRSYYAILAVVWAALKDPEREFESPEDLAELISSDEQQSAALKAIRAMLDEAFPESAQKKTEQPSDSSPTGPSTSSSSASPPASTLGA